MEAAVLELFNGVIYTAGDATDALPSSVVWTVWTFQLRLIRSVSVLLRRFKPNLDCIHLQ